MMLCPGCEGVKKAAYATFIIMGSCGPRQKTTLRVPETIMNEVLARLSTILT